MPCKNESAIIDTIYRSVPTMVKIAQLMIPQPPWGRKYRYFCDPSSRFRDTAVFNFKW